MGISILAWLSSRDSHIGPRRSRVVHYVFNPDHYFGIVIANTTLLYKYYTVFLLQMLLFFCFCFSDTYCTGANYCLDKVHQFRMVNG